MNRRIRLIVECEDALHRSFATRFLKEIGIPEGKNPEINPRAGKAGVLDNVVSTVRSVRNINVAAHAIILLDGDNWSAQRTRDEIDRRLTAAGMDPLSPKDRVLVVVAARTLDTWVRHLRGEDVDEIDHPGTKVEENGEGRAAGSTLAKQCRGESAATAYLPSVLASCDDWKAYCHRHNL